MTTLHVVEHDGRPLAIVVDNLAILTDPLSPDVRRHIQARCLNALERDAGDRFRSKINRRWPAYGKRPRRPAWVRWPRLAPGGSR